MLETNKIYVGDCINVALELNREGWPQWKIGQHLGIHQSAVSRLLKGHGSKKNYPHGPASYNWRGGKTRDGFGYVVLTSVHKREHRVVMEKELGRPLRSSEIVHHKNGIKADNRPENLEIMTRSEHKKHHAEIGFATRFPSANA